MPVACSQLVVAVQLTWHCDLGLLCMSTRTLHTVSALNMLKQTIVGECPSPWRHSVSVYAGVFADTRLDWRARAL
jgi:hypothetical protein